MIWPRQAAGTTSEVQVIGKMTIDHQTLTHELTMG